MSINERRRQRRARNEREMKDRRRILESNTVLSDEDYNLFLKMLENKEPNEVIKEAAKRYKKMKNDNL